MDGASFGAFFKECRVRAGITLREFCRANGYDPGNLSKIERGHFPPPQSEELLRKYATALGLTPGDDDWLEFFDRAAAERGRIPEDILANEQVVAKLPVFFRTLRGKKPTREELEDLIERIRRA